MNSDFFLNVELPIKDRNSIYWMKLLNLEAKSRLIIMKSVLFITPYFYPDNGAGAKRIAKFVLDSQVMGRLKTCQKKLRVSKKTKLITFYY